VCFNFRNNKNILIRKEQINYPKKQNCCILRGPGGERIMDVVPRGTELELQLRRGVGRSHTLAIIPTSSVQEFIRHKQWNADTKWIVLSSTPGILDPFINVNTDSPASYNGAGHCSRYFCRLQLVHKASTLALDPTHCLCDKHLERPHINKKK